jgi:hypothetical protein
MDRCFNSKAQCMHKTGYLFQPYVLNCFKYVSRIIDNNGSNLSQRNLKCCTYTFLNKITVIYDYSDSYYLSSYNL